ncbi:MAG: YceI family protein [Saprospiraceae bacterium]|nr:YceI family protein [Saprospiraceae bacterium]
MNKFSISLWMVALAAVGLAFTNPLGTMVDMEKSTVQWTGKKVTGKHTGSIKLKEASLKVEKGSLMGGAFVIDMTTLANEDLKGEMKGKLEGHLKSPDFFNVAEFPTANLDITSVVSRGAPGSYKVIGDLTVKGITKPIKFNVQMAEEDGSHVATADLVVDRSEYDVRYGSGSFFDNLGDKTIYDEFELSVKLVLK